MKGSDFAASIAGLTGPAREAETLAAALSKASPSWLTTGGWTPVTVSAGGRSLTYYAAPDYFSIGDESDAFRAPMTPGVAQAIADAYGAILPSRRMVRAIWGAANTRFPLVTPGAPFKIPGPDMEKTASWTERSRIVAAKIGSALPSASNLIAGYAKDLVIGPNLDGTRVAIYGAQAPAGWAPLVDGVFIQTYSTVHGASYADYSHAVRLVLRRAFLDGAPVDLADVFQDPKLAELVSDQGAFSPRFPNAGSGALSKVSDRVPPASALAAPPVTAAGFSGGEGEPVFFTLVSGAAMVASIVGLIRALAKR